MRCSDCSVRFSDLIFSFAGNAQPFRQVRRKFSPRDDRVFVTECRFAGGGSEGHYGYRSLAVRGEYGPFHATAAVPLSMPRHFCSFAWYTAPETSTDRKSV